MDPTPGNAVRTPDAARRGETPERLATHRLLPAHREPSAATGLDDLFDIGRLADRLGVEHSTIRVWLSRKVPWLPAPDGRLNGGAVWRATTLVGIEERREPGRPGPKRHLDALAGSLDSMPEQSWAPVGDAAQKTTQP